MGRMVDSFKKQLAWPVFAALLMAVSFPPVSIWPLAVVSWVFVARFMARPELSAKSRLGFLYLYILFTYCFGFYWLSYTLHEFGNLPWIAAVPVMLFIFSLFSATIFPFFVIGFALEGRIRRADHRVLLWAGVFFLWAQFDWKFFPWAPVQAIGANRELMASVGVIGTTGWNALFYLAVAALGWASVGGSHFFRMGGAARATRVAACMGALAVFVLGARIGANQIDVLKARYAERQPVLMLQGNVGNYEKKLVKLNQMPSISNVLRIHQNLMDEFLAEPRPSNAELWTLWPETSFPGFPSTHFPDAEWLASWAEKTGGIHLVGAYARGWDEFAGSRKLLEFNVIDLVVPKRGVVDTYKKMIRMPFGEYIPGDELWPGVYSLLPAVNHFGAGRIKETLEHPSPEGPIFVPLICYEILGADFVDEFIRVAENLAPDRPRILVNPTNDSWYGPTSEPSQHSLLARWQASRVGLPLLRPTNTGLSQVVAPWGEVLATSPQDEANFIYTELPVIRAVIKAVQKAPPSP